MQAGLQEVAFGAGVTSRRLLRHEFLRFARRHAQVQYQVLARQLINSVFQMLDPLPELFTHLGFRASRLVREIGADVAVDENDFTSLQCHLEFALGLKAVACIEQRGEMRVDTLERAQLTVQKLPHHFAEPRVVLREGCRIDRSAAGTEDFGQQFQLRALAAAIDSFDGDQPPASLRFICRMQTHLITDRSRPYALTFSLNADVRRRKLHATISIWTGTI